MSNTATEIEVLEQRLAELRKQKAQEEKAEVSLTPAQKIAIRLHDSLCYHDHCGQCGWFYEISDGVHSWGPGTTHDDWWRRANQFKKFAEEREIDVEVGLGFVDALRKGRVL